jgi:hypothetical protein
VELPTEDPHGTRGCSSDRKTFLTRDLLPLRIQLRHFHSDGGSELIGEQVRGLLREYGISTSHTPRDTPEMNSLLERKVLEIKQRVTCMLLHSTLPLPFWWMAWKTAIQLQLYTPTTTILGHVTPFECVHGTPPNVKRLHIWGSKAYALKPIASRRKDLDSKALSGFLVGYADDGRGYELWLPETESLVTSVHDIINEVIPAYSQEYYAELSAHLQSAAIKVADHTAVPEDYAFLVGTCHRDDEDGLVYRVTRIDVIKGDIVAFRRLDSAATDETPEEKVSIHVADICRMTEDLVSGHTSGQTLFDETTRPAKRAHNPESSRAEPVINPECSIQRAELVDEHPARGQPAFTAGASQERVHSNRSVSGSRVAESRSFKSRSNLTDNLNPPVPLGSRQQPSRACKNIVFTLQETGGLESLDHSHPHPSTKQRWPVPRNPNGNEPCKMRLIPCRTKGGVGGSSRFHADNTRFSGVTLCSKTKQNTDKLSGTKPAW